jgi:hypothetical protein
MHIAETRGFPCVFTSLCENGEQNRGQYRDYSDNDKQFDEGKSMPFHLDNSISIRAILQIEKSEVSVRCYFYVAWDVGQLPSMQIRQVI